MKVSFGLLDVMARAQVKRIMAVTPTSSANQTVASKMMALRINFFFMAISPEKLIRVQALTFTLTYLEVGCVAKTR